MAMRIAVAGFQHETNTFAPKLATYDDFVKHDAWPGLTEGEALLEVMPGINLPAGGFLNAARGGAFDVVPILWCAAGPSAFVTQDAFERVTGMICDALARGAPYDGVYLDLHGAMVTEQHEDGEGELLRRVRALLGDEVPIVVSLDLHANITAAMSRLATALVIYRTYPHIDMAQTGRRAHALLLEALDNGGMLAGAFRKLPFLLPLTAQCTRFEPGASLYGSIEANSTAGVCSVDFAQGFPVADIAECGPAIVAYGRNQRAVDTAADALLGDVLAAEPRFDSHLLTPAEAVRAAMRVEARAPVVLADAQDNPGAGGSSDTVGLLEALIGHGARGAVLGVINDPQVARLAHAAGRGAVFDAPLGGKSGQPGQAPFDGRFSVVALGDGRFTCTGEMYAGNTTALGPMALLSVHDAVADVRVIVGSERFQCLDQAVFRHLGVEPREARILAVKSSVHFRADFDPIAAETLVVAAPGANICTLTEVPYRNLREGVRLGPMGPAFSAS